jgi:hypothetical protein
MIIRNRNYSQTVVAEASGMVRVVVLATDLAAIRSHLCSAGLVHIVGEVNGATADIEFAPSVSVEQVRAALTDYATA